MDAVNKISEILNSAIGTEVACIGYVKEYKKGVTSANKPYISGVIFDKQAQIPFKVWDQLAVTKMLNEDMSKRVCVCVATMKEYQGVKELHIRNITVAEEVNISDFLRTCDVQSLYQQLTIHLRKLPVNWQEVVLKVFESIPNSWDRFVSEQAASGYHDALYGGLLHHTVKMLNLLDTLLLNDMRLEGYADILRAGIILHDLGKIEEMQDGVYTQASYINHRIRGVEYLAQHKQYIIDRIGYDSYNHLISIVLEHHGGFAAEPMHTVYALMVHVIDNCDAQITYVLDSADNNLTGKLGVTSAGNKCIKYDGTQLVY